MQLINMLTSYMWGMLETGKGFAQSMIGFLMIRFYYAIPVFLVWNFIVTTIVTVPFISFVAVWAILVGFDCVRFDITKYIPQENNYEEENQ